MVHILGEYNMDPLFSILIANYNNGRFIKGALESVFDQSYCNWEIIIVDDASTDESREVLSHFCSRPNIKVYFNDRNEGCGYTKNRCVEYAKGEICAFLDPDDKLHMDALTLMAKDHLLMPECALISSKHFECDEKLNVVRVSPFTKAVPLSTTYLLSSQGEVSHFASFKREYYLKTSRINRKLAAAVDQDLYYKLEDQGPISYIDMPLYYYRIHNGGISTGQNLTRAQLAHFDVRIKALRRRLVLLFLGRYWKENDNVNKYLILYLKLICKRMLFWVKACVA